MDFLVLFSRSLSLSTSEGRYKLGEKLGTAGLLTIGGLLSFGVALGVESGLLSGNSGAGDSTKLTPAPPPGVTITPENLECANYSDNTCDFSLLASTSADTTAKFKAVLMTRNGDPIPVTAMACDPVCTDQGIPMRAGHPTPVRIVLTITGSAKDLRPAYGVFGVTANSGFTGTPRRLRLVAPSPSRWEPIVFLLPGIAGIAVAFLAAFALRRNHKVKLFDRMGSPTWSAGESWSSNVTIGAGLVNALLTLNVFNDQALFASPILMNRTTYMLVSALFGSLLALSIVFYSLFRKRSPGAAPTPPAVSTAGILLPAVPAPERSEGFVLTFLASGALTLWASLGQLFLFGLLIHELKEVRFIAQATEFVVVGMAIVAAAGFSCMDTAHSSRRESP